MTTELSALNLELEELDGRALKKAASSLEGASFLLLGGSRPETAWPQGGVLRGSLTPWASLAQDLLAPATDKSGCFFLSLAVSKSMFGGSLKETLQYQNNLHVEDKACVVLALLLGHTPSTAGTFRWKFRKNSGKTPETLSERFLEFPLRVRLGCPKPYNSRHLRLPERFQNYLPPSTAGDASFFRIGSGEGLSELVMEFPAVLGVFLNYSPQNPEELKYSKSRALDPPRK